MTKIPGWVDWILLRPTELLFNGTEIFVGSSLAGKLNFMTDEDQEDDDKGSFGRVMEFQKSPLLSVLSSVENWPEEAEKWKMIMIQHDIVF